MDAINYFDSFAYFKEMAEKNRLSVENGFYPCACSGINSLQDVLDQFRRKSAFIAIDDTNDSATEQRGGGWFKKRTFTIFLLIRYKMNDMDDRSVKLNICRQILRQFHSKMIIDKERLDNEMVQLNVSSIYSREIGEYFLSGCTGLYFMLDSYEPIDLIYREEDWEN